MEDMKRRREDKKVVNDCQITDTYNGAENHCSKYGGLHGDFESPERRVWGNFHYVRADKNGSEFERRDERICG